MKKRVDKKKTLRYTSHCKENNFTGGVAMSVMKNGSTGSLAEPDEIVELSTLYDFYGPLLKENHRMIFEDYVWNNLSLGEIAGQREITRQGVYDVVKRCRKKLREYEEKLQLVSKFEQTRTCLMRIESAAKNAGDSDSTREITELAEEIYRIL